jgi:3-hydroxymyristoyl/3-hydroxydecanoyl-(acyl carrier protein) dehydratase
LPDRVIDIRGEDHGIGIKNVTMNEAHFAGHFPDKTPARFYSLRRNPSRPS